MSTPKIDERNRFEDVQVTWEPRPDPLRFGLIALSTDHASESELRRILPGDEAELFTTRIRYSGHCEPEALRAMGDELAAAAALLLPGTTLDAIAYGCTSGTVAIGIDRVCAAIRSERPGVTVITPMTAAIDAFAALDAGRIAVLTPYTHDVNDMIAGYLDTHGHTVTRLAGFGLDDDAQMWAIPDAAIEAAAADLDLTGADALFISCTALRAVGTIERLEQRLGVPVVTSNQAMAWNMLRSAGYGRAQPGYGRLLR